MSEAANIPAWAAVLTALLLLSGASLALIGSLGLLRLENFYSRVHAPTLGTTLGLGCILAASMVYFSALQGRPVLHELLIAGFVTVTTPVSIMLLARAALYRDRRLASDLVPMPVVPPGAEASLGLLQQPRRSAERDDG